MQTNKRASIVMAVYNGEKYLDKQIESILNMISEDDEIIISYDESEDNTWNIIADFANSDDRISIYKNTNDRGIANNFNNAISHARGEILFISDQDDIWVNNKVEVIVNYLKNSKYSMVIHNGYITDSELNIKRSLFSKLSVNPFRVLIKNSGNMLGCCMAFKREVLPLVYPFYDDDYDRWMAYACSMKRRLVVLDGIYLYHRIHNNNYTPTHRGKILEILSNRVKKIRYYYVRRHKVKVLH